MTEPFVLAAWLVTYGLVAGYVFTVRNRLRERRRDVDERR